MHETACKFHVGCLVAQGTCLSMKVLQPCAIVPLWRREVLVMVMRKHQRYFPLYKPASHELLPHFITVANGPIHIPTVKVGWAELPLLCLALPPLLCVIFGPINITHQSASAVPCPNFHSCILPDRLIRTSATSCQLLCIRSSLIVMSQAEYTAAWGSDLTPTDPH